VTETEGVTATDADLGDVYRPPQKGTESASRGPRWTRWHRLALTLCVPVVVTFARRFLTLPGVDLGSLESRANEGLLGLYHTRVPVSLWSVFSLGLFPWIAASIVVEIAALVVPPWRRLRHGGFDGRRKLGLATGVLASALGTYQAIVLLRTYQSMNVDYAPTFVWTTIPALLGGMALLVAAAKLITRFGLVNGVVALWALDALWLDAPPTRTIAESPSVVLPFLLSVALAVALVAFLGRERAASGEARAFDIPLPATGLATGLGSSVTTAMAGAGVTFPFVAGLVAFLYAAVGVFANRPRRIAALWARALRAKADRTALARRHTLVGVAWGLGWNVAILPLGFERDLGGLFRLIVFTAVVVDGASELLSRGRGDFVSVFPEHRPYALPVARDLLAAKKIPLFVRSRRTRPLFSFFGPFVPMDLCVPREHAPRATQLLENLLAGDKRLPTKARLDGEPAPPSPSWKSARLLGLAGLFVASMGLARFRTRVSDPSEPHAHAVRKERGALALVGVDDSRRADDAVAALGHALLPTMRLSSEYVANTQMHFVETWPEEGESLDTARARLEAWIARIPPDTLPTGDRFAIGVQVKLNPVTSKMETNQRTYVLQGSPIVTEKDVTDAAATVQHDNGEERAIVMVTFDDRGAAEFEAWTASHVQKRLAIIAEGRVVSVPIIQSRIPGGRIQIMMGAGSLEEQLADAKRLAEALGAEP
jgi:hypothetical protein